MKLLIAIGDKERKARGFGPHDPAEFELDLTKRIIRAEAPSGAGKGFFVRVLKRLLGLPEAPEANRDGDPSAPAVATAQAGDHTLRLTLRQKYSLTGDAAAFPVVAAPDLEASLVGLVGPLDDALSRGQPAQDERIRALLKLLDLSATPKQLQDLCGKAWDIIGKFEYKPDDDLPTVCKALQAKLRKRGREVKAEADVIAGRLAEKRVTMADLCQQDADLMAVDFKQVDALLERAAERMMERRASAKARKGLEKEKAAANASLPVPSFDLLHHRAVKFIDAIKEKPATGMLAEDWKTLGRLIAETGGELRIIEAATETYTKTQEILQRPVEGATDEQVTRSEGAKDRLDVYYRQVYAAQDAHRLEGETLARLKTEEEVLVKDHKEKSDTAKLLKTTGDEIPQRMAKLLTDAGLETFKIGAKGELLVHLHGEWPPFAESSLGERLTAAIEAWVGIQGKKKKDGKHRLLFLPIGYGDAITDDNWDLLLMMIEPQVENVTILVQRTADTETGGIEV